MMAQQKDGIDRRQLLLGAPVAGAVAMMPSFGSAGRVDPHVKWFEAWKGADARACEGANDIDFTGKDWLERERLGILIANTVAETPAGIQAQWEWLDADFGYLTEDMLGEQYGAFFRVLKAGMERLA